MIVGSGWHFTSGISYYTCRLANAVAENAATSVLLMRRLVPRWLYPGRRRVGRKVNDLEYNERVHVLDGVDWYWGPSVVHAARFLRRERPDVMVLQWWTGAVLHTYLLLSVLAKARGTRVIMEWHEVQDTGEARLLGVRKYVTWGMRRLLAHVDGHVLHSEFDLGQVRAAYNLAGPVRITPHGPYDHFRLMPSEPSDLSGDDETVIGPAESPPTPPDAATVRTVLYFGVIRPYKGVEDLISAFDLLPDELACNVRLLIVGETWEGWTAPQRAVEASPRRDRIEVINEYVSDDAVGRLFGQADAVALPYRRSSASGPLHIAMSVGLPVLVSDVGGLQSAARDYEGTVFTRPQDPHDIARGLEVLLSMCGRRFADPHSWERTVAAHLSIMDQVGVRGTHGRHEVDVGDVTGSASVGAAS
ncbi:MAG TPA: glycosyltransferase [Kineosporiaceae bacterium]